MEYTATVKEEKGAFWAEVDQLPGCFASGESEQELLTALRESIALYLDEAGSVETNADALRVRLTGIRLSA